MSTQQERAGGSLQLGTAKYLYTGYFVAGVIVAYLVNRVVDLAWGEAHADLAIGIGAVVGIAAVVWGWRNARIRKLATETLDELMEVTWPTKQETYTATVVVIVTSIVSALIIFSLDRFWNWVTDTIYLSS
ncbi:MAG: preprotein translocase subunit SecE [Deltaproteobacteria bacterium]|nr:preprotein translocase subunit SecE [Deltaproteobacteria bacterium]